MEKEKGKNRILIILIIIIGLLLVGLLALKIYKKIQEKKALEEANRLAASAGGSNAPAAGSGGGMQQSNDEFPLEIGSTGERVKYVQAAINRIAPHFKLTEDGNFGKKTYEALITGVRTNLYPVTLANYTELLKKSTSK